MRLYSGTSEQFIRDTMQNQIAEKLKNAFHTQNRYNPSDSEVRSWQNSLRAMKDVTQDARLTDHGIILEYQLPLTSKRLDCLICGQNNAKTDNAVIVELKQWEKAKDAIGENEVTTWVGNSNREVLHPAVQVRQYRQYLQDTHTAFYEDNPVGLQSCAYLHNYHPDKNDILYSEKFHTVLTDTPVFSADHMDELKTFLTNSMDYGNGIDVLTRIEQSKYRPSRKLMEHVSKVIRERSEYILLDEQLVIYDKIFAILKKGYHHRKKSVILIKGGPGTGKSVIAINLMADLLRESYNAHYATGSRAFTQSLGKAVGTRAAVQFKYFNSYIKAQYNEIDVLICDEAHRIRNNSNHRYMRSEDKSDKRQIEELIHASKVSVFFIDDDQVVRPDEVGSSELIREHAVQNGTELHEYELEVQFRCAGSEGFINWINNTLDIKKTPNIMWNPAQEAFDFRILGSPQEVEDAIRQKGGGGIFCQNDRRILLAWTVSNGELTNDVIIGDYQRPWNAHPDSKKLPRDIPKAPLWAYDSNGINQVGCVYTAQGFEFDYAGVIFGNDLVYDLDKPGWQGIKENSEDKSIRRSAKFRELVKNTYRILLSRGMKGCYVYFMDKDTERFSNPEWRMQISELPVEFPPSTH